LPSEQFPKETPAKRIQTIKGILDLNSFPPGMEYQDTKIPDQNQSSKKKFWGVLSGEGQQAKKNDASPFGVGTPQIWYGRRVSVKGLSKSSPDFESGPKLLILFKAGPYSESFDASQAGPAFWKI